MNFFADLHIHSYYSRATSKQLNLEHLNKWGQIKGLSVIATGDITHPKWLQEMRDKLQEGEQGLFRLKDESRRTTQSEVPGACASDVQFMLSGEISTIYKKAGRVRKVHSVVFMPSLDAVERFQKKLDQIGNIHSDGRPILGLDTRDLLEITLEIDSGAQFIPAHIWTPWFSIFGSKSGFDTLEECFEDLTPHIFALETGLSSDPPMNWRLSMLDQYVLVSNSDAHSPAKLAREANLFQTDLNYDALFAALKDPQKDDFWGTIEFFPQEGKYHMDGHRKCQSRTKPTETMANNGLCPVCGKPAVLGVSYRVEELADRPEGFQPDGAKSFQSLIPLPEVLGEVLDVGPTSKRVNQHYFHLLQELGSELDILMHKSIADIRAVGGDLLAEAIRRMRDGKIKPIPGYDGEYGVIRVFDEDEREKLLQQETLFALPDIKKKQKAAAAPSKVEAPAKVKEQTADYGLNDQQRRAVEHRGAPLIIQAGPGTGKTRTLTQRLVSLLQTHDAKPHEILAITFTNKAATEMRERIEKLVGATAANAMTIQTFHAFGAAFLREQEYFFGRDWDFTIISPHDNFHFLENLNKACNKKVSRTTLERISVLKAQGDTPESVPKEIWETAPKNLPLIFEQYEQLLVQENAVDFDDLINLTVRFLSQSPELRRTYLKKYPVLAVDEFQDINKMQYELFRMFAIAARDICLIGDPDQSIYGFRGASPGFFKMFLDDFPHAHVILLQQNYRSAQNILSASLQMLDRGEEDKKQLWSNLAEDVKVNLHVAPTDRAEAEFVVHRIEQHVGGTTFFSLDSERVDERGLPQDFSFANFAILLRSRRLAPSLIEALNRSGIPFQNIDDASLTTVPLVRLVSAVLTAKTNQNPELLIEPAQAFFDRTDVDDVVHDFHALPDDDLDTVFTWLEKFVTKKQDEETLKIFQKLKASASAFSSESDRFLDALMLQKQIDSFEPRADRVHLLTLHAAKGLEFPIVFVVGCEDGVIPHYIPGQKLDIDEERRLLYVGMTRAQRYLYLTRAKQRFLQGHRQQQEPSRFLRSISESLLFRDKQQLKARKKSNQLSLF